MLWFDVKVVKQSVSLIITHMLFHPIRAHSHDMFTQKVDLTPIGFHVVWADIGTTPLTELFKVFIHKYCIIVYCCLPTSAIASTIANLIADVSLSTMGTTCLT